MQIFQNANLEKYKFGKMKTWRNEIRKMHIWKMKIRKNAKFPKCKLKKKEIGNNGHWEH